MNRNYLTLALGGLASLMLLGSCQDEDFGYMTEEVRASVYDRNFIAHYGDIDPNQSWDFSSFGLIDRIAAAREAGMTRGTESFATDGGTWCTEKTSETVAGYTITATKSAPNSFTESHDLLQWVKKRLQEGDRRFLYGDGKTNKEEFNQRFSMIATEKSFQLMPVFQGIDNTIWDLHAVIEWVDESNQHQQADIVLWQKSEGMTMQGERPNLMGESLQDYVFKKDDGSFWPVSALGAERASVLAKDPEGIGIKYASNASDARKALNIDPQGDVRFETTRLAADIKSQWVTVTGYPEKISTINFYLHVLKDNDNVNGTINEFWSDGRETPGSITSNMVVLPVQVDIKEYEDREIVLMGCETALSSQLGGKGYNESEVYTTNSKNNSYTETGEAQKEKHDYGDDDMNDIVFLLIGDEVSKKLPELVNENEIAKRYFFEDLGSVVDWDFNDAVLDMKQDITQEYANSTLTTKIKQTATIKHRCGTTPFDLFLQNTDGSYTKLNFDDPKLIVDGHIKGINKGEEMEYYQTITLVDEAYDANKVYPWRPKDNNVAIKVYPSTTVYKDKVQDGQANTDGVWAEFKERNQGSNIPRVFVADLSVWWTPEDVTFPNIWKPAKDMSAEEKAKIDKIMSMPAGAVPNELSNGTIYGIGSDRSFRYPKLIDGEFVLWNTPTRFDRWEPLWLSEGFMEGLNNGYNTIHVEFGKCNTEFAFLYRADYQAEDKKFSGHDFSNHSNPTNRPIVFTIPEGDATTEGTIAWYKEQAKTKSPSFGIQDYGEWSNSGGSHTYDKSGGEGTFYITINKVWMSMDSPEEGGNQGGGDENLDLGNITSTDFNVTFAQLVAAGATSDDYIIRFNISNTSGVGRNGWGNGGIYPYKSTNNNDNGRLSEWKGQDGNSWTYEYTLRDLKALTSNAEGFRILTWNDCNVTSIDVVVITTYTINVASANQSQGSVEIVGKTGTSFTGTGTVQLKATPATGYKFASWTTPTGTSNDNPLSVTLSEATAGDYTANFAEATQYTITVTAGDNGTVNTTGGSYYEGTVVTFTAVPDNGYKVKQWTKNGNAIAGETKNTLTITVSGNDTYRVEFEEKPATTEITIWSTEQSFTGWYGQLNISNSTFQNKDQIGSQSTMKLYFADKFYSGSNDCHIYIGGWGQNASSFKVASEAASTEVSIPLSETQISVLKTGDLTIELQIQSDGGTATLQKIALE